MKFVLQRVVLWFRVKTNNGISLGFWCNLETERYSPCWYIYSVRNYDSVIYNIFFFKIQDSSGRPQKLVSYKLTTGATHSLYVCKIVHDSQIGQTVSKRSLEGEVPVKSKKKSKPDPVVQEPEQNQVDSEIEKLKLQLSLRDQEISNLNKIIAKLTRKQRRWSGHQMLTTRSFSLQFHVCASSQIIPFPSEAGSPF